MARLLSMAWLAAAAVCANVFAKRTGHHRHHRDRADAVEHERRAEIARARAGVDYVEDASRADSGAAAPRERAAAVEPVVAERSSTAPPPERRRPPSAGRPGQGHDPVPAGDALRPGHGPPVAHRGRCGRGRGRARESLRGTPPRRQSPERKVIRRPGRAPRRRVAPEERAPRRTAFGPAQATTGRSPGACQAGRRRGGA